MSFHFSDLDFSKWTPALETDAIDYIANADGVSSDRVRVTDRRAGSVILDIEIIGYPSDAQATAMLILFTTAGVQFSPGFGNVTFSVTSLPSIQTTTQSNTQSNASLGTGAIVGIVLACVAVYTLLVFAAVKVYQRVHSSGNANITTPEESGKEQENAYGTSSYPKLDGDGFTGSVRRLTDFGDSGKVHYTSGDTQHYERSSLAESPGKENAAGGFLARQRSSTIIRLAASVEKLKKLSASSFA